MTRLSWASTDRDYDLGLDRGVFYPLGGSGHVWNGLISVEESPSAGESRSIYIDGLLIADRKGRGQFAATIEAFTYPIVSSSGLISPRRPTRFDMSYRVPSPNGSKIHLIYNALVVPSDENYKYEEISNFSWSITTRATKVVDDVYVSHLVIDTSQAYPETVKQLEDVLYGSDASESRMPTPEEVMEIFEENSILRIINHGDGTWTAIGPDNVVYMLDDTTFEIDWPSVEYIDPTTYTVHSL